MNFQIVTLFPELIASYLSVGVVGRACSKGLFSVATINPRDFAEGVHRSVDDRPFGGGDGMVMTLPPLTAAIAEAHRKMPKAKIILLSPQGRRWEEGAVQSCMASGQKDFILISARYGGVDQRLFSLFEIDEVSVGDYILAGGELPALTLVESLVRKLPGVLGHEESAANDSFVRGWLEAPQFTRPAVFQDLAVPEFLLSGHHAQLRGKDLVLRALITLDKRPDLFEVGWEQLSSEERTLVLKSFEARAWSKSRCLQCGVSELAVKLLVDRLARAKNSAPGPQPAQLGRVAIALVHYPILDKARKIVATNVTNFDIHDIARAARTYGVERYYIVHPMIDQRMFVERVLDHWRVGEGSRFNSSRREALVNVRTVESFPAALADWEASDALVLCTHAREVAGAKNMSFAQARQHLEQGRPIFLVFGTGYGLPEEFMAEQGHLLAPVRSGGKDDFRHLSVRSAVSVILDRLLGAC